MTNFQQCRKALTGSACLKKAQVVEDIRAVAAVALQHAAALVAELLPEGTRKGSEWHARNPTRADRHAGSFSVSLVDGRWHDFACGDGGGDLVSLAAYLWAMSQADAACDLARRLRLRLNTLEGRQSTGDSRDDGQRRRLAAAKLEAEQRTAREADQKHNKQQAAADFARRLWQASAAANPSHGYLAAKRLHAHDLREHRGELLVPLFNAAGVLVNLQRIGADGGKRFLFGGQVLGTFHLLGQIEPGRRLFVCEGWATGATLYDHYESADAVACAMNAGNLRPVAQALRAKYGGLIELVIAGDDDRLSNGNPGRTAADAAALDAGAMVVFPEWPAGAPLELSDFNDLHCWDAGHDR
ncbi:toprim domain-containing protein [Pseudomonas sp. TNT2022 ID357]|uniref:Toprim domain-containing protein n=1 Tax=Pseudomonas idahonensis TaxID=2942628 RepID=A0ABT5PY35_9PSED|nr:toprim domain-containing protein [Pseudomonas idahonensis]MDD1146709.1 toprim domain-containing protein [Pseudomonas idahonensis]